MRSISTIWFRARRPVLDFLRDRSGIAATEFAFIVPLMLVLFFGTVEFSSGIAVDRKVTLTARSLSDLVSQNTSVTSTQLSNIFQAATAIMTPYYSTASLSPYPASPMTGTVSELYVDPNTLEARVEWSVGTSPIAVSTVVAIPSTLQTGGTYLIYSQISFQYVPTIGYVMAPAGVTLSDVAYTRPRQSLCVFYPPPTTTPPACPP